MNIKDLKPGEIIRCANVDDAIKIIKELETGDMGTSSCINIGELEPGDVIQFDDVVDASFARMDLQKMGIKARYLLERNGEKGIWLEITGLEFD